MKKIYQILCLLLLISFIVVSGECGIDSPTKADDCKDDTITEENKKLDYTHCCYVEQENNEVNGKSCRLLTTRQYEKIGKYIKLREEDSSYLYKLKIDCNSFYLKFYLLSLILFFI